MSSARPRHCRTGAVGRNWLRTGGDLPWHCLSDGGGSASKPLDRQWSGVPARGGGTRRDRSGSPQGFALRGRADPRDGLIPVGDRRARRRCGGRIEMDHDRPVECAAKPCLAALHGRDLRALSHPSRLSRNCVSGGRAGPSTGPGHGGRACVEHGGSGDHEAQPPARGRVDRLLRRVPAVAGAGRHVASGTLCGPDPVYRVRRPLACWCGGVVGVIVIA